MKNIRLFGAAVLFNLSLPSSYALDTDPIAPPSVQVIDRMGVNMATGQVEQNLNTVSIGGGLGLSHSIRVHANHFDALRNYGYLDSFGGGLHTKKWLIERDI